MKKIYTLLAVTISSIGFAQQYELVTSQSNLIPGSKYLIVGKNTGTGSNANKVYVMSTQTANNRASVEIAGLSSLPTTIEYNNTYASLILGSGSITTSNFTFFDENYEETGGYLYAASSSANNLRTQITNSNNGEFSISINTNGSATIIAQGSNTRNNLRFNGSNSPALFSCYTGGQMDVYLYKEVTEEQAPVTAIFNSETLTNFSYVENQGPSASQTVTVTVSNLPTEETASLSLSSTNFTIVSPTNLALGNGTHAIELQLSSGLAVGNYSNNLTLTHNTNTLASLALSGEVTQAPVVLNPNITTSVTTLTALNYVENQGPSTSQYFNITGSDLDGTNVVLTAPTNFEVSTDNSTFATNATLTSFDGASTPIYVRLVNGLAINTYSGNISITGGGITTPVTIALSGEVTQAPVILNPTITTSVSEITTLNYVDNQGPSTSQSFNISGSDLDGTNVVLTASNNFEISTDNSTFATNATLTSFDGTSTPVYVRLVSGLEIDIYTGNISITGGGITTPVTIALTGEVTEDPTASTTENNIEGLKVYPNPATELVNITSNEIGTKNVTIFNMLGKKVLETSTEETINVSTLTSGVYIMNITQDGKKASRKLVIK